MSPDPKDGKDDSPASPTPWKSTEPWKKTIEGVTLDQQPDSSVPYSLSAAVRARKGEYIRKKTIKVKVGTWNVASISGTEKDLGSWFVEGLGVKGLSPGLAGMSVETAPDRVSERAHIESVERQEARMAKKKLTVPRHDVPAVEHGEEIDLYVLGLQEVIDVTSMAEAVKPYTDPNPAKKWKNAMEGALPAGYQKVAEQQLLGLLILIYTSPALAPSIGSVSTTSVGTGLMGYLGNKGAVAVRLMVGETTRMCFVNCHLAAGADSAALERRIWDAGQIVGRTRFSPPSPDGEILESSEEKIGDEDIAFWFGDLNFRMEDIPGEDVRRLLLLHTRNEYDVANKSKRRIDSELGYVDAPTEEGQQTKHYEFGDSELSASESSAAPELDPSSDPASLTTTLQSLLVHDQLRKQQKQGKAFHDGWREGDIHFLPTYKYDVGSVGMFDSGEKKRSPSWCDRILFRTRRDREMYEERAKLMAKAKEKDEAMKKSGMEQAAAEQDILFDYDPDADGLDYGDECEEYDERQDALRDIELVQTREDFEDLIRLEHYISHQRILSSDHKPLDAVFTFTYDSVVPELKAKVHQDVAREMDKAENEARPNLTVVVDNHSDEPIANTDGAADVNVVHFGEVRYSVRKTRMVTVANTGQIAATFSFVGRPAEMGEEIRVAPQWLDILVDLDPDDAAPHKGSGPEKEYSLSPGDSTVIELTVDVSDSDLVYDLNHGISELDDVLVLRVNNGRDHFIPVRGIWLQSCFFRSLEELVLVPEGGVRACPDPAAARKSEDAKIQQSASNELYSLTELVTNYAERAVAEWSMLHGEDKPPWQYEDVGEYWPFKKETWTFHEGEERSEMLANIREALDCAKPIENHLSPDTPCIIKLELLAETLLAFLSSLRDGIITIQMWSEVEQRLIALEKGKQQPLPEGIQELVMDALSKSPVHNVSFTFVTFMMSRIVNEIAPATTSTIPSVAQKAAEITSSGASRRSRESTLSSDSAPSLTSPSGLEFSMKRGFLPGLRRARASSVTSSPDPQPTLDDLVQTRKRTLIAAYSEIFAPLIIRSEHDGNVKAKDKKMLDVRKRKVLDSFFNSIK